MANSERERFDRAAIGAPQRASKAILDGFKSRIDELAARDRERQQQAAAERERRAPPPRAQVSAQLPVPAGPRISKAWLEEQISVSVAKRRASQGRKNAREDGPIGPTPERIAKAGGEIDRLADTKPQQKSKAVAVPERTNVSRAHQVMSPMDRYQDKMSGDVEATAREIMHLFLLADAGPRVTGSYDGAPGGVFGPRPGGVQDYIREARATVDAIEADLGPSVMQDIRWFVTQQVVKQDGSAMKLADSGRMISPWKPNEEKDTAVGYGHFISSLRVLARYMAMRQAHGWHRPSVAIGSHGRQQTLALLGEINKRAERRRERSEDQHAARVLARYLARTRKLGWADLEPEDQKAFLSVAKAKAQERRERAQREVERKRR